ncbi:hypothetical protein MARA_03350 (plasmid) [Mycolicibacterium arabiense]|jgi:hypothetical protein|uniref:Uncharacterized protein n=1 Tax=Mycolicibacterium arabiense TaxID=1286181 RepID=A0A7I7RPW7_9MYCO|nr:hypothetical protein [Mycolicibacterium arabiense]MCV7372091.1 hypothetical protein [Mycolicibacterium arabiense]BBY46577.1 hypothetical protein MARA_00070 [Mycolicibacterium arabiense]BBY46905.1 hypothetical protein MARA_03350 [Mycolicibacterium arabiense]
MFQTDSTKLRNAASSLDEIKNQTLNALGRYVTMNQDLGGSAFVGVASVASMKTTEEVATTGRNVSARFDQVIQAMQIGANEYDRVEAENQAQLSSVATQA